MIKFRHGQSEGNSLLHKRDPEALCCCPGCWFWRDPSTYPLIHNPNPLISSQMWGANTDTWTSGFMHLGASQMQVQVLDARRTSACSSRSDKQLEGVTLYFHHGQTHQLLSFPLKLLAHPTDNRPCSLVRSSLSFWRQSPVCVSYQLSPVD